jgi:glucose/arabinose dehydrogenase/cytochrome c553
MSYKSRITLITVIFTLVIGAVAGWWFFVKKKRTDKVVRQVATHHIEGAYFEKVELDADAIGQYTSLVVGPDKKLYANAIDGYIKRFVIASDGTLRLEHIFKPFGQESRLLVGITFAPKATADSLVAWISYEETASLKKAPNWDGRIKRLRFHPKDSTLLENTLVVTNLPRSGKDHLTNSLDFGTDGALYFNQGSNTGMGRANHERDWDRREENLLSAAVLRLDLQKLPAKLPLDAKTPESNGQYNPYKADSPLTIYATGLRNAYDLVWHSNGKLYVTLNGSSSGKNTPTSDPSSWYYIAPSKLLKTKRQSKQVVPAITAVSKSQTDRLLNIEKGAYYGHPNPLRYEYVLNGGSAAMPEAAYQHIQPEDHFRTPIFDFGQHASPNGIIEYKSDLFEGKLKNTLMIARFNIYHDVLILELDQTGNQIARTFDGKDIGLANLKAPLDLAAHAETGNIYISEFGGKGRIVLFRPGKRPDAAEEKKLAENKSKLTATSNKVSLVKPSFTAKDLLVGKQIFEDYCVICHGEMGEGSMGPNLKDDQWLYGHDFSSIFQSIQLGRSNGMQAWEGKLSAQEISQVVGYILSLQDKKNN